MKKKIFSVLSLCLILVMSLSACGTDPKTVDYNGHTYDELEQNSVYTLQAVQSMSDDDIASAIENSTYADTVLEMLQSYEDSKEECGDITEIGEFSVDKTGNTLTTTQYVKCTNRDFEFQIIFQYYDMTITGYSINPVYSTAEKMSKAGLNTLISMSIVFVILILISLIISCFKIFPYLEEQKKKKAQNDISASSDQVVSQIEQREQQLTDDTELVAVIAAAIAASTGSSTSDFVVRSINRR